MLRTFNGPSENYWPTGILTVSQAIEAILWEIEREKCLGEQPSLYINEEKLYLAHRHGDMRRWLFPETQAEFQEIKSRIVNSDFDTSNLKLIALWLHDNGHVSGVIVLGEHSMRIAPWWADCGATGEGVECSCGFVSNESSGNGCWQYGHDEAPRDHAFDELHKAMWRAAHKWESQQDWLE